ncbi:Fc.00g112510.m01.CDS01 [Cosmosporella sp. VM-42]
MPSEKTVLADVGPGDKTGVYYIPICNLPFGTTWQHLKDFTRSACTVDHIEVFPTSTSGWVRVKGRENFDKAWARLDGGYFQGRSIIASDKNKTHSIKIKELIDGPPSRQAPPYQPTPAIRYASPTSTATSPQYSTASPSQYDAGGYPQDSGSGYPSPSVAGSSYAARQSISATMAMPASYAGTETGDYYNNKLDPSAAAYSPQYGYHGSQCALPHRGRPDAAAYTESYGTTPPEHSQSAEHQEEYPSAYPPDYLPTEQRKLHISPFPQQAQVEEVTSWITRKAGAYAAYIVDIEVPQNINSPYLRGHVFVVFDSATVAHKAMHLISKARFQDRRVTAKLTVEGVTTNETSIPTGPRALEGKSHRSKHKDSKGSSSRSSAHHPKGSSNKKHSSSSHDKKSSSSGKNGSSSSSSDKKKSSPDRKSTKDSGPVIVDGTSRRC